MMPPWQIQKTPIARSHRISWYPDNTVMHAEMKIGDSLVMLGQAGGAWKPRAAALYLWVEDVDATYARALKAGAASESQPEDKPYGHRNAGVIDTNDITWWIGARSSRTYLIEMKR